MHPFSENVIEFSAIFILRRSLTCTATKGMAANRQELDCKNAVSITNFSGHDIQRLLRWRWQLFFQNSDSRKKKKTFFNLANPLHIDF